LLPKEELFVGAVLEEVMCPIGFVVVEREEVFPFGKVDELIWALPGFGGCGHE
jgi:hypothetical protein